MTITTIHPVGAPFRARLAAARPVAGRSLSAAGGAFGDQGPLPRVARRGVLLLAAPVGAADQKGPPALSTKEAENLMGNVKGTFDLAHQSRPYIVFLILDQVGNRYPSFWCGKNAGGTIKFDGRHDLLDDQAVVEQTGGFTVQLTNAARKPGMDDRLPGGVWVEKLPANNFRFTFERFTGATFKGTRRDSGERGVGGNLIQFDTTFAGQASVGGRTAPITGTAVLEFSDFAPIFKIVATFPFPGKQLGLAGAHGEGITATLYTSSATTGSAKPTLDTPAGANQGE